MSEAKTELRQEFVPEAQTLEFWRKKGVKFDRMVVYVPKGVDLRKMLEPDDVLITYEMFCKLAMISRFTLNKRARQGWVQLIPCMPGMVRLSEWPKFIKHLEFEYKDKYKKSKRWEKAQETVRSRTEAELALRDNMVDSAGHVIKREVNKQLKQQEI